MQISSARPKGVDAGIPTLKGLVKFARMVDCTNDRVAKTEGCGWDPRRRRRAVRGARRREGGRGRRKTSQKEQDLMGTRKDEGGVR